MRTAGTTEAISKDNGPYSETVGPTVNAPWPARVQGCDPVPPGLQMGGVFQQEPCGHICLAGVRGRTANLAEPSPAEDSLGLPLSAQRAAVSSVAHLRIACSCPGLPTPAPSPGGQPRPGSCGSGSRPAVCSPSPSPAPPGLCSLSIPSLAQISVYRSKDIATCSCSVACHLLLVSPKMKEPPATCPPLPAIP